MPTSRSTNSTINNGLIVVGISSLLLKVTKYSQNILLGKRHCSSSREVSIHHRVNHRDLFLVTCILVYFLLIVDVVVASPSSSIINTLPPVSSPTITLMDKKIILQDKNLLKIIGGGSSSSSTVTTTATLSDADAQTETSKTSSVITMKQRSSNNKNKNDKDKDDKILIIFSDVDGTLVHYPNNNNKHHHEESSRKKERNNKILKLPASATGMKGMISSKTLSQTQQLRRSGVKLVLVSGMRTSTLLKRLPYLPKADAYCSEAGGRIFYPVTTTKTTTTDDDDYCGASDTFLVTPHPYDGALKEEDDLTPFEIEEDMEWRRRMEQTTGPFGKASLNEIASHPERAPYLHERDGRLWDFARDLSSKGYVLDTKGYSACFRVNQKQQETISKVEFQQLLTTAPWSGLATSVNLACIDYYPIDSGKKNCCQYLSEHFFPRHQNDMSQFLSDHAVCMCDDDNDLEMALACNHAYIPEVSSESMAQTIRADPYHFSQTGGEGALHHGTMATEAALAAILERVLSEDDSSNDDEGGNKRRDQLIENSIYTS